MSSTDKKTEQASQAVKDTKEKLKDAGQFVVDKAKAAADKVADAGRKAVHKADAKARDIKRKAD